MLKIILFVFLIIIGSTNYYAEPISPIEEVTIETENKVTEEEIINYGVGLLDWQSIEALENELASAMPDNVKFNLKEHMQKMIQGEEKLNLTTILNYLIELLFSEISVFLQFGARFILIVLLCNLLKTLASVFDAKKAMTTTVAFFVCYIVILLSVIQSFRIMIDLATTVIDQMQQMMLVCIPILLAFMATSGFNLSAGAMAPIILSTLNLMTYLIKVLVLPCIISVIVLEVISSMSSEFKVSKLISLFYKGIKWGLTSILGISVGILGLYRLLMPGLDVTLKQATVKFSSAFIPVVGSAVGGTIDFIAKCSILIKNTFAGGIVMWLLVLLSIPMIKILSYVCIYQVAGAVIEPLGDKKMANIATKLAKGCQFIMSSVGIIALFCVCALVICASITSSGV